MTTVVPIFRFQRGSHVCVFYRDESSLLEFLVPYVCEGLRNHEKCFLVQSQALIRRLSSALWRAGVSLEREFARGAIELHAIEDVYLGGGTFDADAMIAQLEDGIATAVRDGFSGLRTAGDLGWASSMKLPHDILVRYEMMVEATFPHRPAVGICQYPMSMFSEKALQEVLHHHQSSIQEPHSGSNHSSLSIRHERYTLDVIADRMKPQAVVYYVVQRNGSHDILGWGSENTVDAAIQSGKQMIAEAPRMDYRAQA